MLALDPAGLAENLLRLVVARPGIALAAAAKKLQLSQSQLHRLLAQLEPVGLVRLGHEPRRTTLWPGSPDPPGLVSVPVQRSLEGQVEYRTETVADEVAVALLYNGTPHVVVMATPRDLADLALGFSLSENLVESADQLQLIEITQSRHGFSVHLKIGQTYWEALQQRQRGLNARTGCGLCGTSALEQAIRPIRVLGTDQRLQFDPARLPTAFATLEQMQPLNRACGAVHAAAVLHQDGLLVREDVGRHNALDKVLGAAIASGLQIEAVLLTSRASYEMVHKSAQCGVPVVAAISAPTALAVNMAQTAGIQLFGFVRDGRMTRYSAPII